MLVLASRHLAATLANRLVQRRALQQADPRQRQQRQHVHHSRRQRQQPAASSQQQDILRRANDPGRRAVIRDVGGAAAGAPVVVVGLSGLEHGRVALVAVAEAAATGRLATAVVIGDHVILAVAGIVAGAYPGYRGHLGSGRAGRLRPAATAAQEPVDRAVPPVLAGRRIARIGGRLTGALRRGRRFGLAAPGDWQNRQRRCTDDQRADPGKQTAARRAPGDAAN